MTGRIWLGPAGGETLLSAMGRKLTEEDIEIVREGRTASGKYVSDLIAVKKKFSLEYSIVTDAILIVLKDLYELGTLLSLKIEDSNLSVRTYTVRFKPFSRARYMLPGGWLWEGIKLELEEQ
jgi:hypothetical protein